MKRKYLLEVVCEEFIIQTEREYENHKNALIALSLYAKRHVIDQGYKVIEKSVTLIK